ncbi:MAG: FAD:protein FMN transferase [Planctomycetota bacterium]|nr:FAD:protein FMN transferase [Planctomycetota bacterium]
MRCRWALLITLLLALGIVIGLLRRVPEAEPQLPYVSFTEQIMAAPIGVLLPAEHGREGAEIVFEVFRNVETRMNEWKEDSPLAAANRAAGVKPVAVPDDLCALIRRGVEIGDLTDGAFDITWAALWGLWDFGADLPHVPDADEIEARIDLVDYRLVEIDDEAGTVFLAEKGMLIGLGGIAKGYALGRAADALREAGVDSFLISAGGQMMVSGRRGERPWRIGIRGPRKGPTEYFAYVEVTDTSVSTSGDYERYFILDGERYHHILDPRTGRPANPPDRLRSATVVCADATLADALSTALIVLGREEALTLIESLDGVEAVLVDDEARVHSTSGLGETLQFVREPSR